MLKIELNFISLQGYKALSERKRTNPIFLFAQEFKGKRIAGFHKRRCSSFYPLGKFGAHISWPADNGSFEIDLHENTIQITTKGSIASDWFLDMVADHDASTTLDKISEKQVDFNFEGHSYHVGSSYGLFEKHGETATLRLKPENNTVDLKRKDE
jgi:hypothetical protein